MHSPKIAGYLIEPDIILNAFQKLLNVFRPRKKKFSKTLNPDPTPTSGLGKLNCYWEKLVGCQASWVICCENLPKHLFKMMFYSLLGMTWQQSFIFTSSNYT
ncbi:hypothetical protein TNCV_3286721 [Trichonephila clavipes]|nr:hypothetical protein TNCV_3286721 [Trichonephila clavipes]